MLTVLARTEVELTIRSVAELAGVSANRATVVLNRLVRLGLVERRDVGAAALVRLARDNEAARAVLLLAELRNGVLTRLAAEAKKIRPAPVCLVVFGSFARGEAHENSDIDVLAVAPPEAQFDDGGWTAALGQWTDQAARIAGNPSICSNSPWRSCQGGSVARENRGRRSSMRASSSPVVFLRSSGLRHDGRSPSIADATGYCSGDARADLDKVREFRRAPEDSLGLGTVWPRLGTRYRPGLDLVGPPVMRSRNGGAPRTLPALGFRQRWGSSFCRTQETAWSGGSPAMTANRASAVPVRPCPPRQPISTRCPWRARSRRSCKSATRGSGLAHKSPPATACVEGHRRSP